MGDPAAMPPAPASSAGYSRTPLPRKLGIKPGSKVLVVGAPPGLDIGPLPELVVVDTEQALAEAPVETPAREPAEPEQAEPARDRRRARRSRRGPAGGAGDRGVPNDGTGYDVALFFTDSRRSWQRGSRH